MLTTSNAIGFKFALYGVGQRSRTLMDSATIGFKATPSCNKQEVVLSPAGVGNSPPATVATFTVKSVIFIRSSGKIKVRVTRADSSYYEQIVTGTFSFSPDADVTVTIQTAETSNVSATIVWS